MNELRHIAEFNEVLAHYHLSPAALTTLKETKLVLLLAASASGRNTIINELLKTGDYFYIVSDTTRQPRVNDGVLEENGTVYWFRSEDEVLEDLKDGNFLEAEVIHGQQVSGISIRELEKANASHKIAITDVDVGGVKNIMALKPDTLPILILPPSFKEWQRRIAGRGHMPAIELKRRLQTAARIFKDVAKNGRIQIVISENVPEAARQVNQIAVHGKASDEEQTRGLALAEQLYTETKALLATL